MKSLWKQHVAMHFYGIPSQHPDTAVGPLPVAMAIRAWPSQPNDDGGVCACAKQLETLRSTIADTYRIPARQTL
ncbi:hypothetical protein ROHU_014479 [Labeo rohita]|uniref:Uncharacterized protein n=1 Tax=Labeo rohita TaxID=84645 RepID=A0A498NSZ5_LABRO|nr:hypothetical protein ROHU_014479 [Labeo rohita]